ncbi:metal-binding protein [Prochlorococcus sp. MIT 1307]|uniref:metal-binding protein n=1 Tax=Prochlorococcus sp. MIT 1307 TaxID=3096219 RepID=UPI002A74C5C7|nr:metal-binding protein [Prochlorococcus sp. MIT 1307]
MASGKEHDTSTRWWAAPFALTIALVIDLESGLISGTAFFIGGLWLSPDLDTKSIPLKRWGILQGLWWPYRKAISHRSILSHSPVIGTFLRVAYLLAITTVILLLLHSLGFTDTKQTIRWLSELIKHNPKQSLMVLVGLEASAWLHLMKDGDPLPKRWWK